MVWKPYLWLKLMSTPLSPGMRGGSSPWTFLETLRVASNTFCPAACLEFSSGLPAEVDGDGSGDGAEAGNSGGCCSSCCGAAGGGATGGSLPSLNTWVHLGSCLNPSIFLFTCSSDMHTRRSAGGSGHRNQGEWTYGTQRRSNRLQRGRYGSQCIATHF